MNLVQLSVSYVNASSHCGCQQFRTVRYVAFHDRYGRPVFKYRGVPVRSRCACIQPPSALPHGGPLV